MTPQNTSFWEKRTVADSHKDWTYDGDWISGYEQSIRHPHRFDIIQILHSLRPFNSLLEVGCSVGPNLKLIHDEFPEVYLAGIDPNKDSVERAQTFLKSHNIHVAVGDVRTLGFDDADIILADASLMYITPEEIQGVMDRLALVAKKAVVIVERFSESKLGEPTGGVWGRDYELLLKERGFKVEKTKMAPEAWPGSPNWQKYGHYFVGKK